MNKLIALLFLAAGILLSCVGCTAEAADTSSADRLKDAILAAENGESTGGITMDTHFFHDEQEDYGYHLLEGDHPLPADEAGLRACIDLIQWWCDPAAQLEEGVEIAYQYVTNGLAQNEVECYLIAFGTYIDGEFAWKREFAVDFNATRIFELNVNTLEYVEVYAAK